MINVKRIEKLSEFIMRYKNVSLLLLLLIHFVQKYNSPAVQLSRIEHIFH